MFASGCLGDVNKVQNFCKQRNVMRIEKEFQRLKSEYFSIWFTFIGMTAATPHTTICRVTAIRNHVLIMTHTKRADSVYLCRSIQIRGQKQWRAGWCISQVFSGVSFPPTIFVCLFQEFKKVSNYDDASCIVIICVCGRRDAW